MSTTPFDTLEGAQEYLDLLIEAVVENRDRIKTDMEKGYQSRRAIEVLSLVAYNLEQLEKHMKTSGSILDGLRKLQLMLKESTANPERHGKVDASCRDEINDDRDEQRPLVLRN